MEVEETSEKRKYGRVGCIAVALILIILLILWFTGMFDAYY